MKKIGFIGAGNMAYAIASGIISSKFTSPSNIILYDKLSDQYKKFDQSCKIASNLNELIDHSDCIFLSIKPQNIKDMLNSIKDFSFENKILHCVPG